MNLGDDADTVGAIYGQLAGAFYGVKAIPEGWLDKCALSDLVELFADELFRLADTVALPGDKFPEVNTKNCKSTCCLHTLCFMVLNFTVLW